MTIEQFIAQFEGFAPTRYRCTAGHWTIGYGFNLERDGAAERLAEIGLNLRDMMAKLPGGTHVSQEQARTLLCLDIADCADAVKRLFPDVGSYPQTVQWILLDLVYNLGEAGLKKFPGFIAAIKACRWALAGAQLTFSRLGDPGFTRYWEQTKRRAWHHASVLAQVEVEGMRAHVPQEGIPS